MDGVATAEDPPLRVRRQLCFPVDLRSAPSTNTHKRTQKVWLDPQHSTTSCAAYVHYALCNRTMCLIHSFIHSHRDTPQATRSTARRVSRECQSHVGCSRFSFCGSRRVPATLCDPVLPWSFLPLLTFTR